MANIVWSKLGPKSVQGVGAAADTYGGGAADGMELDGVGAFSVSARADLNQTITAPVNALAFVTDPYDGLPARAEMYDILGQTVTGVRSALIGAFKVDAATGRLSYQNNGGAVSAGNLTFRLIATSAGNWGSHFAGSLV